MTALQLLLAKRGHLELYKLARELVVPFTRGLSSASDVAKHRASLSQLLRLLFAKFNLPFPVFRYPPVFFLSPIFIFLSCCLTADIINISIETPCLF